MTQDEIIEMARQADCLHVNLTGDRAKALERLEAFAKLVAEKKVEGMVVMTPDEFKSVWDKAQAEEREACALIGDYYHDEEANCGDLIRVRGENK